MNLTTLRVWCYACGKEVFLERKLGPHSPNAIVEPLPLPQNDVQVRAAFTLSTRVNVIEQFVLVACVAAQDTAVAKC